MLSVAVMACVACGEEDGDGGGGDDGQEEDTFSSVCTRHCPHPLL